MGDTADFERAGALALSFVNLVDHVVLLRKYIGHEGPETLKIMQSGNGETITLTLPRYGPAKQQFLDALRCVLGAEIVYPER